MRSFFDSVLAVLAAIGLIVLLAAVVRRALSLAVRSPTFRRSAPYQVNGRPEFRVLGIANPEDVGVFLRMLNRTYGARILDKDIDPDELWWKVGQRKDWVEIYYADHLGARVRAANKSGSGLFSKLLDNIKA